MRRPHFPSPLIEPLESRIAPAALIVLTATSYASESAINPKTHLPYLEFINAADPSLTGANLAIAKTVGRSQQVYFIKVSAGEDVRIPTNAGFTDLVDVSAGNVVAFFTDPSSSGTSADAVGPLTGLALGTKVSVGIGTAVDGDIATNYNDVTGTLGGATEAPGTSTMLLPNIVNSLNIAGNVTGTFYAGAAVNRFTATGAVNEVLTGTAANGHAFSFAGAVTTPGDTTFNVPTPAAKVAGPSMSNVIVGSVNFMQLGSGGPGAAGGSISGLTLLDDTTGITVMAGAGGAGAAGRTSGGAGGSITGVVFNGPQSTTTVNSPIILDGGAGGAGLGSAHGGAGGAVQNVFVDYGSASASNPAATTLPDDVTVQGGAGGQGGTGGAGGGVSNVNLLVSTPHLAGGVPELQLLGGAGGASPTGGKGGAGGSVTNSRIFDVALPLPDLPGGLPDDTATDSPTNTVALIQAGAGGAAAIKGAGGAGGSVVNATLKGYNFELFGGAGGDGVSSGGAGGGVSGVTVLGSVGDLVGDNYHVESLVIGTGAGGDGTLGKGGAGGSMNTLTVDNADFGSTHLDVSTGLLVANGFQVTTGSGGTAGKGAGGNGGTIYNIRVTDSDFLTLTHPQGNTGEVDLATGNGGAAPVANGKGGAGGSMQDVTIVGTRIAAPNISTGNGGAGGVNAVAGKGGAGGTISGIALRTEEDLVPPATTSTTTASTGLLLDPTANFGPDGDDVVAGVDMVENTLTDAITLVTAVTNTELTLASDIFATGDPYLLLDEGITGTAADSQNTIIDSTANFTSGAITVGELVEVVNPLGSVSAATVTQIVSATQLNVSADISQVGDEYYFAPQGGATFIAGAGGAGVLNGAGGAGGSILNSSANMPGAISFTGGAGGAGGSLAAAGAGGTLNGVTAGATYASGFLEAGNAGATGEKPGAGGSIIGGNVEALTSVAFIAGNGTAGGAGGSITGGGFSGILKDGAGFNPPSGNITIEAGTGGSSGAGNGGAGGSVTGLTGFISSGDQVNPYITQFDAGAGGGGQAKGGVGGSVSNIRFFGGGGADVTFFINAGDAGNAATGKTGATGGSVTNVGGGAYATGTPDPNFSISSQTDFHHISAGNGGNAVTTGGLGGSVTNVFVNAAIGLRTGAQFGFDVAGVDGATVTGAGGISAGAGGTGVVAGMAGNVTNISADAIASIVAGHLHVGQAFEKTNLATKVDHIILTGSTAISTVDQFELYYDGERTVLLPTNATPVQVASALDTIIDPIQAAANVPLAQQGVAVTTTANGFVVTFNTNGAEMAITGDEPAPIYTTEVVQGNNTTSEVQNVQTFGLDPFTLTFGGQTTSQLPANATALEVQDALDAIIGANAVNVTFTPGSGSGTVTTNPVYTVTWAAPGPQPLIVPNFALTVTQTVAGSNSAAAVETVNFPTRGDIDPSDIATANFVGSIADIARPNATTFSYTPTGSSFAFGDVPIDGMIAAITMTSNKNFAPEAFITEDASGKAVLIDNIAT